MFWASVDDCCNHLSGTLVQYGDDVVYVRGVGGNFDVHIKSVAKESNYNKTVNISEITLDPLPLGYLNRRDCNALFVTRAPSRRWKHGADEANLRYYCEVENKYKRFEVCYFYKGLQRCLNNEYPSMSEAASSCNTVAFSRLFAIDGSNNLMFRGKKVGIYNPNTGIELRKKHQHLTKLLETK